MLSIGGRLKDSWIQTASVVLLVPNGMSRPVSLILGLEPALDLVSIVLRRFRRPAYSSHLAPVR
jgi:hypothetical protein